MDKKCIACGMPMVKAEDYAMGDMDKAHCKFCAREDGSMQSYDDKLASLSSFIVNTQGLDQRVAEETARGMMSELPAWKS